MTTREVLATLCIAFGLIAIAWLVSILGSRSTQSVAANGFVLLVLVIGVGAFVGSTGILSFGHAAFAAIGAYSTSLLTVPLALKLRLLPHLPEWLSSTVLAMPLAIVIAMLAGTLVAALIGSAVVRLPNASAAIATLGLLIISNSLLIGAVDYTRGAQAIYGIPEGADAVSAAVIAAALFGLVRLFKETRWGLQARAMRDDEAAARSIGIKVSTARLVPWILSGAIVALGGALTAHRLTVISPKEFFFAQSFEWLVALIVGGMLSVSGNVFGAGVIVLLVEVLRRIEEGVSIFGMSTPQVFGLTDAGLAAAILWTLIRRGSGLSGNQELDAWGPFRSRPSALTVLGHGRQLSLQSATPRQTLTISDLSKSYGGVVALDGVSFELKPGEILGLIGPNGSGKSTLLGCVSGALRASGGAIRLGSSDLAGLPPEAVSRGGVARSFQNIRLFASLTVAETIEVACVVAGRTRHRTEAALKARILLDEMGLAQCADRSASTLAYGDQRRLEIARALACDPSILLLDEPAAGMNEEESAGLARFLQEVRKRTGIGIMIVEHDLSLVLSLCDRIVVLDKGRKIVVGTPREVVAEPAVVAAYLGRKGRPSSHLGELHPHQP